MQDISHLIQLIHQILSDPAIDLAISSFIAVVLARSLSPHQNARPLKKSLQKVTFLNIG